jgi:diacylglycerol kinase family enzyme
VFFAVVANADPWTFAGNTPLRPTPDVTFDSGLGVYARRRMSAAGVLFSMARLVGNRPRIGRRGAHYAHDVDAVTVWSDEPMPFQVDGEYLGQRTKVSFRTQAGAIRVVM